MSQFGAGRWHEPGGGDQRFELGTARGGIWLRGLGRWRRRGMLSDQLYRRICIPPSGVRLYLWRAVGNRFLSKIFAHDPALPIKGGNKKRYNADAPS